MRMIGCGLAAAMFAATPAAAAKGDFQTCDGYPAPGTKSDGIVTAAWMFGLASANADFRRAQAAFGAPALAACEAALADPLLEPRYWLRRANLLQAKGLHLIVMGKDSEAIAALADSDSAAPQGETLFRESIGFGNRALRSLALYRLNRRDEARAELAAIERGRPYANSLRSLARTIRLQYEGDTDTYFKVVREEAPYDPNLLSLLFRASILYGRFDEAAAAYGQISFDLPRNHGDFVIQGLAEEGYEQIAERADLAGAMGYTLVTQGKAAAAGTLMSEARRDLQGASYEPIPNSGSHVSGRQKRDYEARIAAATRGGRHLDDWETAIALRSTASTLDWQALSQSLQGQLPRDTPVAIDLIRQSKAATEEERRSRAEAAASLAQIIDEGRRRATRLDYAAIAKALPRPETAKLKPSYKGAGDGIILSDAEGAYAKKHKDNEEALTVGYASNHASPAIVEEMAMLAAAMKTREAGKDSFIIESRMLIQRSITSPYAPAGSGVPSGYDSRLRIRPVNSASLSGTDSAARWRLIDARQVYDRLYPKFKAPDPAR